MKIQLNVHEYSIEHSCTFNELGVGSGVIHPFETPPEGWDFL